MKFHFQGRATAIEPNRLDQNVQCGFSIRDARRGDSCSGGTSPQILGLGPGNSRSILARMLANCLLSSNVESERVWHFGHGYSVLAGQSVGDGTTGALRVITSTRRGEAGATTQRPQFGADI
jgi:hypothetical protein